MKRLVDMVNSLKIRDFTYLIECDKEYLEESTSDLNLVYKYDDKECYGYKFYYKLYSNGICKYGCYDKNGKWWSSRAEVINEVFGLDLVNGDIFINNKAYGLLSDVLSDIKAKFNKE